MLNFLGNSKTVVGIAITQNVGLEVGIIDKKSRQVVKYACRPLEYNIASREIENYETFKALLEEIYSELNIGTKQDVYVVLPNVHFDFTNLPIATMNDAAVAEHILNKIEESNYIFRRLDPLTGWDDVNFRNRSDSRYIVHSSLQAQACDRIRDVVQELGGNVVGIEGAYSAILRGIEFSGIASGYIESNDDWDVLLINSNSYVIFAMQGNNLVDYSEFPLALRSFSPEEVYQAIANPASQILMGQNVQKLLIVSQSDEVSAEILKNSLSIHGEIVALNSNKYSDTPIVFGSPSNFTTLSLIGACVVNFSKFPLKLDVLYPRETNSATDLELFGTTIPASKIDSVSGVLLGIIIVVGLIVFGASYATSSHYKNENDKLEADNQQKETEIASLKSDNKANINEILNNITKQNLKIVAFYNSLAVDIPRTVWLSHFESKNGNQIYVEGMATNIKDIYEYYKSLKLMVPSSSVTLSKLKMVSNLFDSDYSLDNFKDDLKLYSFAIGSEINSASQGTDGQANNAGASGSNANGQNPTAKVNQDGNNVDSVPPDINLQPINDEMFN